ncbi:hypothetical protein Scep_008271 [Stephania cephalantha]|uniref:Uncharacterized protein n=1 Tax=Stephania cephalantha TaxID=152367 RepID=A0AAP0PNZ1_9MAGN
MAAVRQSRLPIAARIIAYEESLEFLDLKKGIVYALKKRASYICCLRCKSAWVLLEGGGDEYKDKKRPVEATTRRQSFDRLFFTLYSLYTFIPLSANHPIPLPNGRRSTTATPTACSTFARGSGSKRGEGNGCCCDPHLVYIGLNLL